MSINPIFEALTGARSAMLYDIREVNVEVSKYVRALTLRSFVRR